MTIMKSAHSDNGREHVKETPDVSHIRNVDVTHELSDVDLRGILTFVVGLTVMTIVVYLLMLLMFNVLSRREQSKEPERSPMAMSDTERLPPEPRLQSARGFGEQLEKEIGAKESPEPKASPTPRDPLWEIKELRQHWDDVLKYGGKDQNGEAIMPIEQAKQELLKVGLPARTKELPEEGPGWQAADYGVETPTAASSGRTTEKRRQ